MRYAMLLLMLLFTACDRGQVTETYELQHLAPEAAMKLIDGHLTKMTGASVSDAPPVVTLSGPRAKVDQILDLLRRYDKPEAVVRFRFQLVEADGFTATDTAIADVEAALRDLFRFRGYRLAAQAVSQAEAPGMVRQQVVLPDGRAIGILVNVRRVVSGEQGAAVTMDVSLTAFDRPILGTSLTVPTGKTAVVGSAQTDSDKPTLILVVRPEIQ